ncbi:MAG: GNAT family N-acetyltransferase [Fimbriimonas sp.]
METYRIRRMRREEADWAVEMAAREGWNPGLSDAEAFYRADPEGFFIGELGTEPVGCISAVAYGADYGFIGLYVVRPEFRGRGYGIPLWRRAMARLEGRNMGLDGVLERQRDYARSGFVYAHGNVRYRFSGHVEAPAGLAVADTEELLRYDRRAFPEERDAFLRYWATMPQATTLAAFSEEGLRGYGTIRPCRAGYKIGPLFADDAETADQLFRGLVATRETGDVYLDVPVPNEAAGALAARYGMERGFETARMYTRGAPAGDLGRIFGITTFELG